MILRTRLNQNPANFTSLRVSRLLPSPLGARQIVPPLWPLWITFEGKGCAPAASMKKNVCVCVCMHAWARVRPGIFMIHIHEPTRVNWDTKQSMLQAICQLLSCDVVATDILLSNCHKQWFIDYGVCVCVLRHTVWVTATFLHNNLWPRNQLELISDPVCFSCHHGDRRRLELWREGPVSGRWQSCYEGQEG